MKKHLVLAAALLSTFAVAACDKSGDKASTDPKKDESKPAAKNDGPAKPVALPKLKLTIAPQGEVLVADGMSASAHMLSGPSIGALEVEEASASTPKTSKEASAEAQDFKPKNLKAEDLSDGYAVTFDNTGSVGANYFVQVYRTIGGKAYKCDATVDTAAKAAASLAACKTLKAQ